ncbi:MAG: UDP-N-acetylmuramoyl-tripeptide--D-alanyl-D-alanine ligase [Ectothiorhodospiraceae bacterium]
MIAGDLDRFATPLAARRVGPPAAFQGVATDSRKVTPGCLFVALRGERFDGHAFVDAAVNQGAAAVVVADEPPRGVPALVVADTRQALGALGQHWRCSHDARVIGVTGSNGKTTVKQMLTAILGGVAPTLATAGNLNNDLGVPLTLCRLAPEHRFAVIEMGANHQGEIACLTRLAEPTIGVVTNAGPAHLEGFGSLDGVAHGKGELFAGLPDDGIAVINADDAYAPLWQRLAGERRTLTFGLDASATVTVASNAEGASLVLPDARLPLGRGAWPRHQRANAAAAAATALAAGVTGAAIAAGLAAYEPAAGRLARVAGPHGSAILDDTYNANPGSLDAALEVLAGEAGPNWLVLGNMGELGEAAAEEHARAGREARRQGVERLYALGELSAEAARAFGTGARHFADRDALIAALAGDLQGGVTVLIKGSRSMGMEHVVAGLRPDPANGEDR